MNIREEQDKVFLETSIQDLKKDIIELQLQRESILSNIRKARDVERDRVIMMLRDATVDNAIERLRRINIRFRTDDENRKITAFDASRRFCNSSHDDWQLRIDDGWFTVTICFSTIDISYNSRYEFMNITLNINGVIVNYPCTKDEQNDVIGTIYDATLVDPTDTFKHIYRELDAIDRDINKLKIAIRENEDKLYRIKSAVPMDEDDDLELALQMSMGQ